MRIALFVTCLADSVFPGVGQATVRLLERLGHEVTFPQAQTCCGHYPDTAVMPMLGGLVLVGGGDRVRDIGIIERAAA